MDFKFPNLWDMTATETETAVLSTDEILAFVAHFQIIEKKTRKTKEVVFAIVRKGDKVIGRNIHAHSTAEKVCSGHTLDFVEYPLENENDLVKEIKTIALATLCTMVKDPDCPANVSPDGCLYLMHAPKGSTNTQFLEKLEAETDPETTSARAVIATLFELSGGTASTLNTSSVTQVTKDSRLEQLDKLASESELIAKYGKKNIDRLAKKMNYVGEIINNKK